MTLRAKTMLLASTAIAFGACGFTAASAQVDEIVVTTQKKEATLIETPVAVSVVGADSIEKSSIRDIQDLQILAPSLDVVTRSAPGTIGYNIRGFGTSSDNFALEPSVPVFVDGVYKARQAATMSDFIDIERVEVLRGPQATLYGRNAVAGAIAFTTRRPDFDRVNAQVEGTYGNYNTIILKGRVSGPISENVAFSLSGSTHTRDGFLDNVSTAPGLEAADEFNNRDRSSLRGQLMWEGENASLRLIAEHSELDEDCCAAPFSYSLAENDALVASLGGTVLEADPFNYEIAVNGDVNTTLETNTYSAELNWDLGFADLVSITAYDDFDETRNIDADFTDVDLNPIREQIHTYEAFSQEVRLLGSTENVDWMVGGQYYDQELFLQETNLLGPLLRPLINARSLNLDPLTGLPTPATDPTLLAVGGVVNFLEMNPLINPTGATYLAPNTGNMGSNYSVDTEAYALFGQFDLHVTDRLTLTAGARIGQEKKSVSPDVMVVEPFSALDFVAIGTQLGILQGVGQATMNPNPTPTDVANFAAAQPTIFAQIQAGAAAAALDPNQNALLELQSFQYFPPANGTFATTELEDDVTAYTLIASYDLTDDLNTYVSYTTGYKPSGFNLAPSAETAGNTDYANEDAKSIEVGIKGRFFENMLTMNAAIFDTTVENFQTNSFDGVGFSIQNAGELEVLGLEIEGEFAPTDYLNFTYGWTHLAEAKYNENLRGSCPSEVAVLLGFADSIPSCFTTNVQDISGNRLSEASKNQVILTGNYYNQIGDLPFFARVEYYTRDEYKTSDDTDSRKVEEGFTLVNASMGLSTPDEKYQAQLWVKNLFEEEYRIGDFNSIGQVGNLNSFPSDPRTYGITLRAKF